MKKVLAIVLSALLLVAALVGCASKSEPASNDNNASADTAASTDGKLETLKVGASSTPHAEILEQIKPLLAEEGYDLNRKNRCGICEFRICQYWTDITSH